MNKPIHYATPLLKKYRDERDWSQQYMAEFLTLQLGRKISRSALQKWEERKRGLNAELVLELAKVLKIQPNELVDQNQGAAK